MIFTNDELRAEMESELDADESFIDMCEWTYVVNGPPFRVFIVTAITQKNFYVFNVKFDMAGGIRAALKGNITPINQKVLGWHAVELKDITNWQFRANKSKGVILAYTFGFFGSQDGSWIEVMEPGKPGQSIDDHIRFKESFELTMSRFAAAEVGVDFTEQLASLGELFKEGILTDAEFSRAKELFIGRSADTQQQAAATLRSLKQLKDSGILTDGEFAAKKWDVITK